MVNAKFNLNLPSNETIKSYTSGTPEREDIKIKLKELKSRTDRNTHYYWR